MKQVAIIGGGPGGATLGTLLRKYRPDTQVVILERERFPREHVGESQLPIIGGVLHEMGVWDKVEAERFPIKIGATYRWGKSDDLWDFEFLAGESFRPAKRPGKYTGQRRKTAFQVERSRYDQVLLDHAEEMGCSVRQETAVRSVERDGNRVTGLILESGERVEADAYVDASGASAILRRAMEVEVDQPTSLQNVAFWSYWNDIEWAVTIGDEATRVNVMSLGYGWIWFIPIAKTRASVGLVVPARFYKQSGKRPEDLYHEALQSEPLIRSLLARATNEGKVYGTKDWSFVSRRMTGENWYLVGEAAGFADPILAAGLSLTHVGARELAYTLVAIAEGTHDATWLKHWYETLQSTRIRQHIRFADYWYTANAHFSELKEFTRTIAIEAGLDLEANQAFQWLGTGGFANDDWRTARVATFTLGATKQLTKFMGEGEPEWVMNQYNLFQIDLKGARQVEVPIYHEGKIEARTCWERDGKRLPMVGAYRAIVAMLGSRIGVSELKRRFAEHFPTPEHYTNAVEVFEAMLIDGWIAGKFVESKPTWGISTPKESDVLHFNRELAAAGPEETL